MLKPSSYWILFEEYLASMPEEFLEQLRRSIVNIQNKRRDKQSGTIFDIKHSKEVRVVK